MPNTKSAQKRVRVTAAKTLRNQMAKSAIKTYIKKFETLAAEGNKEEAEKVFRLVVKKLDQAAAKGILKKNTVARRKSRLGIMLNKIGA